MFAKELKERIITSLLIAPIVILIALPWISTPFYFGLVYLSFVLLSLILLFEIVVAFERKYFHIPKLKKAIFGTFLTLFTIVVSAISLIGKDVPSITSFQESLIASDINSMSTTFIVLFLTMVVVNLMMSSLNVTKQNYFLSDSILSIIVLYISISVGSMLAIKLIDIDNRTFFLAFTLGVCWFSEAGGLIIGKTLGRTKLSFLASPNKTLEGTLGMVVTGIVGGIVFKATLELFGYQSAIFIPSYWEAIVLSLVIVFFGFFGDIIESLMKRFFEIKDSSDLLSSLGGVFDVFDGVMFASVGVLIYYLLV